MADSKRFRAAREKVESTKIYALSEAVKLVKSAASAKFDETVEVAINLGIDAKQSDQVVRGMIAMPNGVGKTIRVAVFAKGDKAVQAQEAGADIVGAEDLAEKILKGGAMDFDRCIATPDMMALMGRLGKVLGPRGLMPNPKLGTVTTDVAGAVKAAKSGQVEFRADKNGIIHAGIGKASFSEEALAQNLRALVDAVAKAKPASSKGTYLKKLSLASTMGPGVKVDIASLQAA